MTDPNQQPGHDGGRPDTAQTHAQSYGQDATWYPPTTPDTGQPTARTNGPSYNQYGWNAGGQYTQPGQWQSYAPPYGDPYGQAPQYGAPLPQGVPGYAPGAGATIGIVPLDQPDYRCSFGGAVTRFFKKFAVFSGRASRREFWWTVLFLFLCDLALGFVGGLFTFITPAIAAALGGIWKLAILVPFVALAVRRLHDANRSGWWLLLPGIPYVIAQITYYVTFIPFLHRIFSTLMHGAAYGIDDNLIVRRLLGQVAGVGGPVTLACVCMMVFLVAGLVLMCATPDPAGARFDAAPRPGQAMYAG